MIKITERGSYDNNPIDTTPKCTNPEKDCKNLAYRRLINAERFSKLICKHLKIKVEDESVDFTKDLDTDE